MPYQHFSIEEREAIQKGLWEKRSVRDIARQLGRYHTSVSREIQRNLPLERFIYTPRLAEERALQNRKSRGREERLKNTGVREYVVSRLKRRWSPEQIAGRIQEELGESISHEAVYQYVYAQIHRQGYGDAKPGCEDLRPFLRRKRKRRLKKGARRCQRVFRPRGASIDQRPPEVSLRSRVGDWEGDTVESRDHKPGLNTLVERATGLVCITKLQGKTAEATNAAVADRFLSLPPQIRHTLTLDNGPENQAWQELEAATGLQCFFAHAYHSWERGCNENVNGLIRDYYPKKTDFTTIPEEELAFVEQELNSRPRKRLGWKTPLEAMAGALQG
ncbi:MAG: IS30 family transposase [Candidatus Wildermuthbacteria bacterium]|nr:IS30 family transposase [Candidatus Wildermuthbacteria bacterium]